MKPNDTLEVTEPSPMPVDTREWAKQLNLSNFVNSYYQYRDIQSLDECKKILIIGPGQGLDTEIFKWRGYDVSTFDIDETFKPDYMGSVHDLSQFDDHEYDAIIASHVLEHLPVNYLNDALQEISRVSRYALIYLPVHGRHIQFRFIPGFKGIDVSFTFNLFNYFVKPDGLQARYMGGQHFWEVGMRGWRVKDLEKRFSKYFEINKSYRNKDWLPSYNFVLKSKVNNTPEL